MKYSRVHNVSLLVCSTIVLLDCTVFAARSKPKAKSKKYEIAFENAYYTSRFEQCKKLRVFNPVETFKAQGYAAATFRKCLPKMVVRLGSKYNFPAYGIMKLTNLMCWATNLIYGYLASDGTLIIPVSTPTRDLFGIIERLLGAMRTSNHTLIMKHRGSRYKMGLDMMLELVNDAIPCIFDTEEVTQTDGDFIKHFINHGRVMLL